MYSAVFVPTPKYVPPEWETTDLGEFVQYNPEYFQVWQIPNKQRMGLRCIKTHGKIQQPVGLTDYSYMFADTKIGSLDMSGWDFSNVSDVTCMFKDCRRIDNVKCDDVDLSKCTSFYRMFYNCDSLDKINIENWKIDVISNSSEMFAECSNLKSCVIGKWNVNKLDEATAMFENCKNLKSIDLSGWTTPDLAVVNRMFKGCVRLKSANVKFTNVKSITDMDRMFMDCDSLKDVELPNIAEMHNVTMYLTFDGTPKSIWPQEYIDYMRKRESQDKNKGSWY